MYLDYQVILFRILIRLLSKIYKFFLTIFLFSLSALQNEFLELQSEAVLSVPNESELISYWKNLKYVNLRLLAAKILSIFSTTYICESTFQS